MSREQPGDINALDIAGNDRPDETTDSEVVIRQLHGPGPAMTRTPSGADFLSP